MNSGACFEFDFAYYCWLLPAGRKGFCDAEERDPSVMLRNEASQRV